MEFNAGDLLTARHLALLAASGCSDANVHARVKVGQSSPTMAFSSPIYLATGTAGQLAIGLTASTRFARSTTLSTGLQSQITPGRMAKSSE